MSDKQQATEERKVEAVRAFIKELDARFAAMRRAMTKPLQSEIDEVEKRRRTSGGVKIFSVIAEELGLDIRTICNIDLHIPAVPETPMTATIEIVVNRGMEDAMIDEANANNAGGSDTQERT